MALELQLRTEGNYIHRCRLPWPVDPEVPEGHVCDCGRRWVYQPARWDPLLTLEELRIRQEAGEFSDSAQILQIINGNRYLGCSRGREDPFRQRGKFFFHNRSGNRVFGRPLRMHNVALMALPILGSNGNNRAVKVRVRAVHFVIADHFDALGKQTDSLI